MMKKMIVFLALVAAPAAWCADVVQTAPAAAPAQPAVAVQPATQPVAQPVAQSAAQPAAQVVAQPAAQEEEPGILFCLARGICNITTGWLEIPRCIIYDNGMIPVFGLIVGIPEGAGFAVARTLCGVYDIVTFGTSGSTCHGKIFPNTIFQSKWSYERK